MNRVPVNSINAWVLAARPKTLAAGSVPVIVASALAVHFGQFKLLPAVLCLLFALLSQIASNFSNDYFDFTKQTDNEARLGPARAVASGWIPPESMLAGTVVAIGLACLFGSGLIYYGGWAMILVGAVCVVSLLAYTAGPWRPIRRRRFSWPASLRGAVFCQKTVISGESGLSPSVMPIKEHKQYE